MKVCLMALTGFGNRVAEGLAGSGRVSEGIVFSRSESGPFPYHPCEPLPQTCRRHGMPLHLDRSMADPETQRVVAEFGPDVILVATFDQKVPAAVIGLAGLAAVNIHPSLLPAYRGPTPTHWTIINGETKTGLTYHRLTDRLDRGEILWQVETPVGEVTDGQLRRALADLAGATVGEFLDRLATGRLRRGDARPGTGHAWPRITSPKALDLLRNGSYSNENVRRGLTPYPGPQILR